MINCHLEDNSVNRHELHLLSVIRETVNHATKTNTMYKLTEENGKIKAVGTFGTEAIHVVHCAETLEELREDVATPYLVAEECGNFARVHLLTEFSEDEALQKIAEYLQEKEEVEPGEEHLIGVFECEIV